MPLSDQTRILDHRLSPRIVLLWQALQRLKTVASFMNSGAHPDDEGSAMLAAMGHRDGIDISYACSTRGDGGQNDIGTETGTALGVLRTAEMERAAQVLNMRLYWLGQDPDDPIRDFGFSKSGEETLGLWGHAATLRRFVEIVRTERPDILCPTFLDVPGQHGHHRAMTQAAHEVMGLAADPAYDTGHPASGQSPWQISKLYLPAWSGAGQAYDDDLPPPPATLTFLAAGRDPVTGFSYEQIGQQSRAYHQTQAMGRWVPPGPGRDWPLHLAETHVPGPDAALTDGLPATLTDLGLGKAQAHFDAAIAAFPDDTTILAEVSAGLALLQTASPDPATAHKVTRKITQAATVLRLAAGVDLHAALATDILTTDDTTSLSVAMDTGGHTVTTRVVLPQGWTPKGDHLTLKDAPPSAPMPDTWLPDQPAAPYVALTLQTHGTTSTAHLPLETAPLVLPAHRANLDPGRDVVNLRSDRREIALALPQITPADAVPQLDLPDGWKAIRSDAGFDITLPADADVGRHVIALTLDGKPAQTAQVIRHPHVPPRALTRPALLQVDVIDCALPKARIGYIGGGNDQVAHWLTRAGFDVVEMTDADLTSDSALASFDALIVGIFAVKFREALAPALPRLHRWTEQGGTLLTLYHRPWDNWNPNTTPPKRIEIGQPSLRWRVTDQTAKVTHLTDHPVLSHPNQITAADWEEWDKERGLYFAKSWDAAYTPLLGMADPGEQTLKGALLSAEIGKGRHSHAALILHHQLAHGVAGAYRLMANLLAPRS